MEPQTFGSRAPMLNQRHFDQQGLLRSSYITCVLQTSRVISVLSVMFFELRNGPYSPQSLLLSVSLHHSYRLKVSSCCVNAASNRYFSWRFNYSYQGFRPAWLHCRYLGEEYILHFSSVQTYRKGQLSVFIAYVVHRGSFARGSVKTRGKVHIVLHWLTFDLFMFVERFCCCCKIICLKRVDM